MIPLWRGQRKLLISDSSSSVNLQAGRWYSNFDTYSKDSHKLGSTIMVFLGNFDFSNGEGDSSIDGWWECGKNDALPKRWASLSELQVGVAASLTTIADWPAGLSAVHWRYAQQNLPSSHPSDNWPNLKLESSTANYSVNLCAQRSTRLEHTRAFYISDDNCLVIKSSFCTPPPLRSEPLSHPSPFLSHSSSSYVAQAVKYLSDERFLTGWKGGFETGTEIESSWVRWRV